MQCTKYKIILFQTEMMAMTQSAIQDSYPNLQLVLILNTLSIVTSIPWESKVNEQLLKYKRIVIHKFFLCLTSKMQSIISWLLHTEMMAMTQLAVQVSYPKL